MIKVLLNKRDEILDEIHAIDIYVK